MRKTFAAAGEAVMFMTGLGATTAASSPVPASARSAPVLYGAFGNWKTPRIEPRNQVMGNLFTLINLRWTRWNGSVARAGGTDRWTSYPGGTRYWPSTIILYRVRTHNGHPYYSRMKIASHGHKTDYRVYWGNQGGWYQAGFTP